MPETNPFAPLPSGAPAELWSELVVRDGLVVTPTTATWPARCVKCDVEVPEADLVVNTYWYPRWTIVLFVLSRLIGLVAMMLTRKKVKLTVGLCAGHRAQRTRNLWIWGGGVMVGAPLLLCAGGLALDEVEALAFGMLLSVVGFVGFLLAHRLVTVKRVAENVAMVKAPAPFTASLPSA